MGDGVRAEKEFSSVSAATHGHDDFQPITLGKASSRMQAARHDLAIALYGHLATGERKIGQERREGCPGNAVPGDAVHDNGDGLD